MKNLSRAPGAMRQARLPDAELAYDDQGSGRLTIYAHGMLLCQETEERQGLLDWPPLPGRRLIRYDARGHGRSSGRPINNDYAFDRLADDLLALLDHLKAEGPVDAVGASMGCATVLHAAVRAPHRFGRLVLLIPPRAWETRVDARRGYQAAADQIERDGRDAWVNSLRGLPLPPALADVTDFLADPDVADTLLPAVLRGLAGSDLPDRTALAVLSHPTLIIAWDKDSAHPLSTAREIAELIPGAELRITRTPADRRTHGRQIASFLS
ncbi:alpha/beta fold hydrolase [Nonomuraea insulae]|uniref:Alpha/beta fold hydrolase n=1 Tax=Nonomuraea insulae TaxID=1616787 RepID=A0ABW1CZV0_9ACTN